MTPAEWERTYKALGPVEAARFRTSRPHNPKLARADVKHVNYQHDYTMRDYWEDDDAFSEAVEVIQKFGRPVPFGRKDFNQLYANGFFYWTMQYPGPPFNVINRKVFSQDLSDRKPEYDLYGDTYDNYFRSELHETEDAFVAAELKDIVAGKHVIDLGCGTGRFLEWGLDFKTYRGVDPSEQQLRGLVAAHGAVKVLPGRPAPKIGFTHCYAEDLFVKPGADTVVVALFGSPSYVHPETLNRLCGRAGGRYLMHYAEDYLNEYPPQFETRPATFPPPPGVRQFNKYIVA